MKTAFTAGLGRHRAVEQFLVVSASSADRAYHFDNIYYIMRAEKLQHGQGLSSCMCSPC